MDILLNITIILGLASVVLLLFNFAKLPSVVGFLLTGIVAGPYGLKLFKEVEQVQALAEIGILLLLFTIGLEFSLKRLWQVRKLVLLGGFLQLALTTAAVFGLSYGLGRSWQEALFMGFLISMSSTAIVLKLLQQMALLDTLHGKATIAILIFQDIIIVPLMLIAPFISGEVSGDGLWKQLAIGGGLVVGLLIAARYVLPPVLDLVARSRSNELFLLFIVVICFAVAFATSEAGLSLSLGAFLAGLVIAESAYAHQALSNVLPLRTIFTSLFFVSIGMLLDLSFVADEWSFVLIGTLVVIALKSLILLAIGFVLRLSLRAIVLTALSLWQVGEFAFILSETGAELGLITGFDYQLFLSVSILSMGLTPFVILRAPKLAARFISLPAMKGLYRKLKFIKDEEEEAAKQLSKQRDHLVIIGYGLNGMNVAHAAKLAQIPYAIIDSNPETVLREREKGEPIIYGDATMLEVQELAGLHRARIAVIATSDPIASESIVSQARQLNHALHIVTRTRYVSQIDRLTELGADEVIPEEFQTSLEIFARVLGHYLVPENEILDMINHLRQEHYAFLRDDKTMQLPAHFSDLEVRKLKLDEHHDWIGKSLEQIHLRKQFGLTVLTISRGSKRITNPSAQMELLKGDVLITLGEPKDFRKLERT